MVKYQLLNVKEKQNEEKQENEEDLSFELRISEVNRPVNKSNRAYATTGDKKNKGKTKPTTLNMSLPSLEFLPYENPSFYQTLFQILSVAQIIEIFTYLLFERSVIIVAHEIENLLPTIFALKSFLYPLRVCMIIPHLFNDGEDFYNNLLSQVTSVISDSTVFGI